jgi:hypothetical protein
MQCRLRRIVTRCGCHERVVEDVAHMTSPPTGLGFSSAGLSSGVGQRHVAFASTKSLDSRLRRPSAQAWSSTWISFVMFGQSLVVSRLAGQIHTWCDVSRLVRHFNFVLFCYELYEFVLKLYESWICDVWLFVGIRFFYRYFSTFGVSKQQTCLFCRV